MLKSADGNSLVVLDEIGRGTSTYDGLSLAQAILEYLLIESGSLTLFATHYHELTQLSLRYPQVKNAHMSIREQAGEMEFLYTLVKGSASKSYGIHVAKLAGIPAKVTRRAQSLLKKFEMDPQNSLSSSQLSLADMLDADNMDNQVDFLPAEESFSGPNQEFVDELREISIDKMTPMDALNKIATWQKHLS